MATTKQTIPIENGTITITGIHNDSMIEIHQETKDSISRTKHNWVNIPFKELKKFMKKVKA